MASSATHYASPGQQADPDQVSTLHLCVAIDHRIFRSFPPATCLRTGRMEQKVPPKKMNTITHAANPYATYAPRLSLCAVTLIAAMHAGILVLLTKMDVVPMPTSVSTLMVDILRPELPVDRTHRNCRSRHPSKQSRDARQPLYRSRCWPRRPIRLPPFQKRRSSGTHLHPPCQTYPPRQHRPPSASPASPPITSPIPHPPTPPFLAAWAKKDRSCCGFMSRPAVDRRKLKSGNRAAPHVSTRRHWTPSGTGGSFRPNGARKPSPRGFWSPSHST
jgi:hypothetical protein